MATPPDTIPEPRPARTFLSYAHADEPLLNELRKHLAALRRQNIIATWHDRDITAGREWAGRISQELEEADVILLLISPDFINSDYCWDVELRRAMERHDAGEALVVPIFLRPCDWKGAVFGKLQGLPTDARPVTGPSWSSHDEAFAVVATGIRNAVMGWQQRGATAAGPPLGHAAPSPTAAPAPPSPAFRLPKLRTENFNPYQAARELLSYLEEALASRMAALEAAGYTVDHSQHGGRVRFRVLAGDQTVYFLDMWQGGLSGDDKGLSFFHGWGNRGGMGNSTTATATPVPDEYSGEARLDVLNMSLLGYGNPQRVYAREEFVGAVWDQIVHTVDQLGRR